jgi:hypothetical protein
MSTSKPEYGTRSATSQHDVPRVLHCIRRNCEAIARILDDPAFPAASRAIHKRILAFSRREEQLMGIVGAVLSYRMAFQVLDQVLKRQ